MNTAKLKPKSRKMWANYYAQGQSMSIHGSKKLAQNLMEFEPTHQAVPVAVIPLHDPEALVDAAVTGHYHLYRGIATRRQAMRAALTAIGVLPKSKGGRK